jgi:hypothetical protein
MHFFRIPLISSLSRRRDSTLATKPLEFCRQQRVTHSFISSTPIELFVCFVWNVHIRWLPFLDISRFLAFLWHFLNTSWTAENREEFVSATVGNRRQTCLVLLWPNLSQDATGTVCIHGLFPYFRPVAFIGSVSRPRQCLQKDNFRRLNSDLSHLLPSDVSSSLLPDNTN